MKNKFRTAIATICIMCGMFLIISITCSCNKDEDSMNQLTTNPVLKSGSGSTSARLTWEGYAVNVYCDGTLTDAVTGTVTFHIISHYQQGNWMWDRYQYSGHLTSTITGESFTVTDEYVYDPIVASGTGHCNMNGNMGSHYILHYIWIEANWNDPDYGIQITSAVCPEN